MGTIHEIGIMFCGGCNCYFDREILYNNIKKELGKVCNFNFYKAESDNKYELIVIINGCQSECLISDNFNSKTLLINNKNYQNAVELIKEELK